MPQTSFAPPPPHPGAPCQVETTYLERDQSYCTDVRDEYVRHFLYGELVTGQVCARGVAGSGGSGCSAGDGAP